MFIANITKAEMIEVMDMYFIPFYQIIGAVLAVIIIVLAVVLIIRPFIRRV